MSKMDSFNVVVVFSCDIFGGFSCNISIDDIKDIESVVNLSLKKLKEHLTIYKFEMLLSILQTKKYHIHNTTLIDIFQNPNNKIYICSHV